MPRTLYLQKDSICTIDDNNKIYTTIVYPYEEVRKNIEISAEYISDISKSLQILPTQHEALMVETKPEEILDFLKADGSKDFIFIEDNLVEILEKFIDSQKNVLPVAKFLKEKIWTSINDKGRKQIQEAYSDLALDRRHYLANSLPPLTDQTEKYSFIFRYCVPWLYQCKDCKRISNLYSVWDNVTNDIYCATCFEKLPRSICHYCGIIMLPEDAKKDKDNITFCSKHFSS